VKRFASWFAAPAGLLIAACAVAGCSGGGGSSVAVQPIRPELLSVNPNTLTFITTGQAAAQSSTATEGGYTGTFSASSTNCANIATISPASGSTGTFSVTPVGNGLCTFTVSDANNNTATISVSVTISGGTIKSTTRGEAK
jgi:hypothetical protein